MSNAGGILEQKNKKSGYITLFRAIACFLIINSHCREIYPLYYLAVGGGHGNSIFFVLSGYCLACITYDFPSWYRRRSKRILPVTIIVLLLAMILDSRLSGDLSVAMYLNRYWFVWAIFLYYCLFYYVFYKGNLNFVKSVLLVYWVLYFILYIVFVDKTTFSVELEGFSLFKVYFYFGIFVAGGLIRLNRKDSEEIQNKNMSIAAYIAIILGSGILWCAEYAAVMVFKIGFAFQFLIHVSIFMFAVAVLLLGICLEDKISIPDTKAGKFIRIIADSTLEIYLIQVTIQKYIEGYRFPANWIIFVGITLVGGITLNMFYSSFSKRITQWRKAQ